MKKFLILQKLQFRAALASIGNFSSKDKREVRKAYLNAFGGLVVFIAISCFVGYIADRMASVGLVNMVPAIAIGISAGVGLVSAFFRAGGTLFSIKDWDFVSSLPILKRTLVVSKLANIYFSALGMGLFVCLPGLIIYFLNATPSFFTIIYAVFIVLLAPIIPVSLGTCLSLIITWVGSHFRRVNVATGIVTILFLVAFTVAYYAFARGAVNGGLSEQQIRTFSSVFQPVNWAVGAILTGNFVDFISFAIVSLLLAVVVIELVNIGFYDINIRFQQKKTLGNYSIEREKFKGTSVLGALVRKEAKMLINTPSVIGNSLFGLVISLLVAGTFVILKLNGIDAATLFMSYVFGLGEEALAFSDVTIPGLICGTWQLQIFIVCMLTMFTMNQIAACCISLEGQTRWIASTLPISRKTYLISKLMPSLIVYGIGFFLMSCFLAFGLGLDLVGTVTVFLLPLMTSYFSTTIGFFIDLKRPNYAWKTSTEVTKKGMAVGFASASVIIVVIADMISIVLFGEMVALLIPTLLFICGTTLLSLSFKRTQMI